MTGSQLLLLGLVVIAAIVAGYFIGRWSTEREIGARSARPNPLPGPAELPDGISTDAPARVPTPRQRGAPPPASAGGDVPDAGPVPVSRQRPAPPASAGGATSDSSESSAEPRRARRGQPPPAAAGILGTGHEPKRDR